MLREKSNGVIHYFFHMSSPKSNGTTAGSWVESKDAYSADNRACSAAGKEAYCAAAHGQYYAIDGGVQNVHVVVPTLIVVLIVYPCIHG